MMAVELIGGFKPCKECKEVKPESEFWKPRIVCKACCKKRYYPQQVRNARIYYAANKDRLNEERKQESRNLKREIVSAYGGKCGCCGEARLEFLTVDHTGPRGSGSRHREQFKEKGRGVYRDLKKQGFPQLGYRILCFNCNIASGFYGYCPHDKPMEWV